jgi:ABC-type glycerol-3-phosphate transport system permease component
MKNVSKKSNLSVYAIVIGILLLLYSISVLIPLFWGVMSSFKQEYDMAEQSLIGLPDLSYWELYGGNVFSNYAELNKTLQIKVNTAYFAGLNLDDEIAYKGTIGFFECLLNTLLYAGGTAFFGAIAPCIVGYLCAKFKYKFSGLVYGFVLFAMVMPIVGNTSAVLVLMRRFYLYDTIWGMWIKAATFANTYFLIFFAFFSSVSDTYAEAAQIDGASYFRVMWGIYIPLAIKMVTTVFLIAFVAHYNDYNTTVLYIPTHPTLAYAVLVFSTNSSSSSNTPANLAASMVLAVPMVLFFVVFKKRLMGDVSLGGIKE